MAWDLASLSNAPIGTSISFDIGLAGTVNDAGTEINDFATSAGNGLFAGLGGGQSGPNEGANENGVNANVVGLPFDGFLNSPGGFDFDPLDFNNASLYSDGIGTISVGVVPEPSVAVLLAIATLGVVGCRRRRD